MVGVTKLAPGGGHVQPRERLRGQPGSGDVLLEVAGIGSCGTDLHIRLGLRAIVHREREG